MRVVWLLLVTLIVLAGAVWMAAPSGKTPAPTPAPDPAPVPAPVPAVAPTKPEGPAAPSTEGAVERVDARTIRLGRRFEVSGNGSEADPYRITWNLLGSSRETVKPD